MTAINSNRAIRGPVTAVPVVAGKGVRLVADTENNRWVVEADETVLWENSTNAMSKDMTWPQSLSESINNFEKVQFWFAADTGNFSQPKAFEFIVGDNAKYSMSEERYESTNVRYFREAQFQINGTSLTNPYNLTINWNGASISGSNNNGYNTLYKIVGVNRIQNG